MNPDMNLGLGRGELAWAFGLDAVSFAVSAWTLSRVRALPAIVAVGTVFTPLRGIRYAPG